jgi:hypothetical protein
VEELLGKIFLLPSQSQNTLIQPNVKGIVLSNKNRGQGKANAEYSHCGFRIGDCRDALPRARGSSEWKKREQGQKKANAECGIRNAG